MASGGQFVMMDGLIRMQLWSVDSLATSKKNCSAILQVIWLLCLNA